MRTLNLILLGLMTLVLPLKTATAADANGVITANAGTTFTLGPSGDPGILTHTVNGLAQVNLLGNCRVHFDVLVQPGGPGEPWLLEGTVQIISADGNSSLNLDLTGSVLPDFATGIGDFHYDGVITSGTGKLAGARGVAEIDGAAMFTSDSTGTATWLLKGVVVTGGRR
jgi:hypothetical protein